MKKPFSIFVILLLLTSCRLFSQDAAVATIPVDNLKLPGGYLTSVYGSVPHFSRSGKGKQSIIIIPGWGFDESVFKDFVREYQKEYTIFTVTIPGYGKTTAPPLPQSGTSYGDQYWNNGVLDGLLKLIENEGLQKPVIVGHFVQGSQLALRLAIESPEKVSSVIVIGGPAKFILVQNGEPKEFPLKGSIAYVDKFTAPQFFKGMSKPTFDEGNYMPDLYSVNAPVARKLWAQSAKVPLPVMINYLCEFFASDITLETGKIKCPVLILRSQFKPDLLSQKQNPTTNYIKPQFIDVWDRVASGNPLIKICDIENSGVFTWKDQEKLTHKAIRGFLRTGDAAVNK